MRENRLSGGTNYLDNEDNRVTTVLFCRFTGKKQINAG